MVCLSRRTERHENENVRFILIKGKIFYQEEIKLKNNQLQTIMDLTFSSN
jgi:hypothetical protein